MNKNTLLMLIVSFVFIFCYGRLIQYAYPNKNENRLLEMQKMVRNQGGPRPTLLVSCNGVALFCGCAQVLWLFPVIVFALLSQLLWLLVVCRGQRRCVLAALTSEPLISR